MKGRPSISPRNSCGFTLVELLVVVTIIVVLLALLVPAIDGAVEATHRAVCATNLRAIYTGTATYAAENKQAIFIVRSRAVQHAFDSLNGTSSRAGDNAVDWVAALSTVGLAGSTGPKFDATMTLYPPSKVWTCPSRGQTSAWDTSHRALYVGYQYFGGIERWINPNYVGPSASPVKVNKSLSHWVLSADTTFKISGQWAPANPGHPAFVGMPSHKLESLRPSGGNQVHMDGSVAWIDYEKMVYIHSWDTGGNRKAFWYQSDLPFNTAGLRGSEEP